MDEAPLGGALVAGAGSCRDPHIEGLLVGHHRLQTTTGGYWDRAGFPCCQGSCGASVPACDVRCSVESGRGLARHLAEWIGSGRQLFDLGHELLGELPYQAGELNNGVIGGVNAHVPQRVQLGGIHR